MLLTGTSVEPDSGAEDPNAVQNGFFVPQAREAFRFHLGYRLGDASYIFFNFSHQKINPPIDVEIEEDPSLEEQSTTERLDGAPIGSVTSQVFRLGVHTGSVERLSPYFGPHFGLINRQLNDSGKLSAVVGMELGLKLLIGDFVQLRLATSADILPSPIPTVCDGKHCLTHDDFVLVWDSVLGVGARF